MSAAPAEMLQIRLPLPSPRPVFVELIALERRLGRLSLSDYDQDAELIAAALNYVASLNRELDRIRPPNGRPLPWDYDG